MTGIYQITSPSGRIYIGQSLDIERRFKTYKNKNCSDQPKLYNSFLKYGIQSHRFKVVEYCDISQLNNRERFWQEYFDSVASGLNCCYVNSTDKTGAHSEETKEKISKSAIGNKYTLGYKHREESKLKIGLSNKGKRKGVIISQLQRANHSRAMSGGGNSTAKIVFNIQNGVFNDCIKEAAIMYGVPSTTLRNKLSGYRNNNTNIRYA